MCVRDRYRECCVRYASGQNSRRYGQRRPVTVREWSQNIRKSILIASLNATRNLNAFVPSCSTGMFEKHACQVRLVKSDRTPQN